MKRKTLFTLLAFLVMASMVLTACQPAATPAPTEAPPAEKPTEAAPPTEAPTAVPPTEAPKYEGLTVTAPNCDYGGIMKEIAAVDALTVRFSLCVPDPAFLSKVAFSVFAIQPREWIEKNEGGNALIEQPIGTGAFMLDKWNRGDSITFKRFDDYWGEKAKVSTVVFRWSAESAARLLELQSGTVDGIDNPAPEDFAVIEADATLQLKPRQAMNIFYVGMTNTFPPFDNVKVRQAVAMAIDRQRIIDTFYPVGSSVATHFTPCFIPNGCTGDEWYKFDPVAAKALLAEAGFPDGFETKITYRDVVRGYLPKPGDVATDIQAQLLENLGIKAEIVVMESGAFLEESAAGRVEGLHLLGWTADYPHITNFLDYHFGKNQKQFGDSYPEIYENLLKGAQIADPKAAEEFYIAANNAIKELVPMVAIAHGGSGVAYRADVEGGHASPLGNEYFGVVKPGDRDTFVWMQNGEPPNLYCADETDGEALRACEQVLEALYSYEVGGTAYQPALATSCEPNADLTEYVCKLREGVKFHDGSDLDANDVVMSYSVLWDASSPYHKGNTGAFEYWVTLWNNFINAPE
ncbi:MAG: ABC transporter substrate-binding protein [Anaerolineales bacterium]|nr:ABC transporter substrate-binding protein [Anaerolineales bacterium]